MLRPKRPLLTWSAVTNCLAAIKRMEQRRVHGAEHDQVLGLAEKPGGPGDGLERGAHVVGVAAIALPAADRQHELDAVRVAHPGEREIVLPVAGPALGHVSHAAAGGAVRAEQADLERVAAVHRHAVAHGRTGIGWGSSDVHGGSWCGADYRPGDASFGSHPGSALRQINHAGAPCHTARPPWQDAPQIRESSAQWPPIFVVSGS